MKLLLSLLLPLLTYSTQECSIDPNGVQYCKNPDNVEWNETDLDHLDPRILPPEVYGLPCLDDDKACKYFREKGECMSNPNYMYAACRISCGVCEGEDDPAWPKKGNVGVRQTLEGARDKEEEEDILDLIRESRRYLHQEVLVEDGYKDPEVIRDCTNRHEKCAFWTNRDYCDKKRDYMKRNCSLSCQLCKDHGKFLHGFYF